MGYIYANVIHSKWIDVGYKYRERHKVNIQYFNTYKMCHPLPQDLVALDRVQFRNKCVGYLRKLGILFFRFMNVLNRIGINVALVCMSICVYSV